MLSRRQIAFQAASCAVRFQPLDVRSRLDKSMQHGFADGCEARLRLAGQWSEKNGLRARYGLWPKNWGQSPNRGHSPLIRLRFNGEA